MKKLLILNYHRLVDFVDSPSKLENHFNVRRKDFVNQLELIDKNNIPVISLNDAIDGKQDSDFAIAITFDDGNTSDLKVAAKLLKAYDYPATFFPLVKNIENKKITEKELKEIHAMGMEIGSHGVNHPNLKELTRHEQFIELNQSKQVIENIINDEVKLFSLPHGLYNNDTIGAAKEVGYKGIMTSQFGINCDHKFIYHRWAIRNNTAMTEFENVITGKRFFTYRKSVSAKLRTGLRNVIGLNSDNTLSVGLAKIQATPSKG